MVVPAQSAGPRTTLLACPFRSLPAADAPTRGSRLAAASSLLQSTEAQRKERQGTLNCRSEVNVMLKGDRLLHNLYPETQNIKYDSTWHKLTVQAYPS